MADTQTTNLGLIKFETGSRQGTWATSFATEMDKMDAAWGTATAVNSTGGSPTADDTYMQKAARIYTGTLVSDYLVTIPDGRARVFFVDNQMVVGTFQLKFKHASTSAVVIPSGRNMVLCDGTNIHVLQGFDINSQTALTAPDTADSLALYDNSASALTKISLTNFFKVIDTLAALTAPDVADEVVLYDASGTAAFKMTLANLWKVINSLTALTAPDVADVLALYDASATATTAITLANLFKVINTLTADATPDGANDYVVTYDTSASAAKKVLLNTLTSASITAATVTEIRSNTAGKFIDTGGAWGSLAWVALTDGATVTPNMNNGINFTWTLGAAGRTLAFPTNVIAGQSFCIEISQDATGSRTATFAAGYHFSGSDPVLSTAPSAVDVLTCIAKSTSVAHCSFIKGSV